MKGGLGKGGGESLSPPRLGRGGSDAAPRAARAARPGPGARARGCGWGGTGRALVRSTVARERLAAASAAAASRARSPVSFHSAVWVMRLRSRFSPF